MSFAGHIYDMIRRDKENRDLRKNLRGRMAADRKCIIGSYRNCSYVTPEKLDQIRKELKEKSALDEYRMNKEIALFLFLFGGVIIVVLVICLIL